MDNHSTPYSNKKPENYNELIEKYRKVKPVLLEPYSASNVRVQQRSQLSSGLEPYTGDWGREQASHLLRRTLFGVRKTDLDQFSGMSMTDAADTLLQPSTLPPPPVNDYDGIPDVPTDPNVNAGDTWVEAPFHGELEGLRIFSLKSWILGQMLNQEASLHQKLALFWHNLLPTQMWGVFVSKTSYAYWKMLLDNSFGNYKDLIKKLTLDSCMLIYLNGTSNNKDAPDENYGRELQELFCIGKGPNSGYTESDVQAAARVLTGWVVEEESLIGNSEPKTFFHRPWHDTNDKQFSSFYGNTLIEGRAGKEGEDELDDMLTMIFDTNELALYICRRLYNFFVYHEIDSSTETNVIEPLAEIFRDNNYEILPVLDTLFKSAHFYDTANMGASIKNPVDHLIGMWRSFEIPVTGLSEETPSEQMLRQVYMVFDMADRGMEIGDPPNVAGWRAYYQAPSFDKTWITSDSIQSRVSRQDTLLQFGHVYGDILLEEFSLISLVEDLNEPVLPRKVIAEVAELLLGLPLSESGIDNLESILSPVDNEWTLSWFDYTDNPTDEMKKEVVESRLRSTFRAMLQLGEFQLM